MRIIYNFWDYMRKKNLIKKNLTSPCEELIVHATDPLYFFPMIGLNFLLGKV